MDELTRLAVSAREGNRLSLGSLIRKTQADVWRTCNHLGPYGMADDLTQDTYVKMMRSLPHFRCESGARTWLLSIARHVCIDALRTRKRRQRLDALFYREQTILLPDHCAELDDVIGSLGSDQRAAFVLTQVLGLSYDEAAEVCECSIGTIRSRVARARERLIAQLSEETSATN